MHVVHVCETPKPLAPFHDTDERNVQVDDLGPGVKALARGAKELLALDGVVRRDRHLYVCVLLCVVCVVCDV